MIAVDHLASLFDRHPSLKVCATDIERACELMLDCFRSGGIALLAGNGGSAADADHWAGELLKGFESKRPLPSALRKGLPDDVANKLQDAVPAIPLTSFPALRTAVANDIDPRMEFAQLVHALARPGSLFIGLSTSGNATNVCLAAQVAAARDMGVIGLTGETGGKLRELCDVCIRVPSTRTCHVQEWHLPIYHTLCLMIEDAMFGQPEA